MLPFSTIWWNISSSKSRPHWLASLFFEGLEKGDSNLDSCAYRNMSSHQDVISITSSVGTRGSSTVHSVSSWEEKSEFLPHQNISFLPMPGLPCRVVLKTSCLHVYKRVFNITNRYVGNNGRLSH